MTDQFFNFQKRSLISIGNSIKKLSMGIFNSPIRRLKGQVYSHYRTNRSYHIKSQKKRACSIESFLNSNSFFF